MAGPRRCLTLRFYADLAFFLPPARRERPFAHSVEGAASVKDVIESLGVPHPEVALALANGESVGFGYAVQDGDRISVYPRFLSLDLAAVEPRAAAWPPAEPRFVLDTHLGRLAAHLRMVGFDTLYRNDYADEELARVSDEEGRILLTRDLGLLKRGRVTHGYFVRATQPEAQLAEVLGRLGLRGAVAPFSRCVRCNALLAAVPKAEIEAELSEATRRHYDDFRRCQGCAHLYWRGSHVRRVEAFLARVLGTASDERGMMSDE